MNVTINKHTDGSVNVTTSFDGENLIVNVTQEPKANQKVIETLIRETVKENLAKSVFDLPLIKHYGVTRQAVPR